MKIAEVFERWVNPFSYNHGAHPPARFWPFVWHFVQQARWPYLAVIVTSGMVALIEAGFFYYIGRLVDVLDQAEPGEGWAGLLAAHSTELLFMAIAVLGGRLLFSTLNGLLEEQTLGRSFDNLVRWQAYTQISRQSVAFFSNEFAGRLVTKVAQAATALHGVMSDLIQVIWFTAIYVGTTAFMFGALDWRMLALIFVWLMCFAIMARFFVPRMRKLAVANAEASAMTNGRIVDSISNIQTLKLFGTHQQSDSFVKKGFETYLGTSTRLGRMVIAVRASLLTLSSAMLLIFGILCIDLWTRGEITVGAIAFALSLVLRLNMMLARFMGHLNGLMRNFGVLENAMDTISQPIDVVDDPDAIAWSPTKGHICFNNLGFRYVANNEVIENFNLEIRPGEKVGLVGRSGAGKSTIVNLLLRFYDVDSGSITIDGQDIARVQQETLRAGIGVVTQDTSLLHRSIRENIKYGRQSASDGDMIAAAKRAKAHEFIVDLEDRQGRTGYDAHVGERGVKLSGGQRQRIAIARVLLKDAPILVLDEATSALDSEVEAAIQSQLQSLMQGKTVIAIAHRLSTIAALDRLVVIDGGHVLEQGSHDELLAAGGHYADLWKRQSGGFLLPQRLSQSLD